MAPANISSILFNDNNDSLESFIRMQEIMYFGYIPHTMLLAMALLASVEECVANEHRSLDVYLASS